MRLGLHVNRFTWPGGPTQIAPTLAAIARRAEEAGFSSLSVMDHFFQIAGVGPPEWDMLEAYTTLGFVAAQTKRLRLGTMVTGVTYRHPGILVKTATTLDVLSGGRSFFGVGAAWYEAEHVGLGVPFPPVKERFERLEETLQIALAMWSGQEDSFHGKHYRLERLLCVPPPIQRPHPPIVIGGGGERKTLRLVARYADACNLFEALGIDELRRKLDVLREHCETVGRPYDAIEKSVNARLNLTRDGRGRTGPAPGRRRRGPLRPVARAGYHLGERQSAERPRTGGVRVAGQRGRPGACPIVRACSYLTRLPALRHAACVRRARHGGWRRPGGVGQGARNLAGCRGLCYTLLGEVSEWFMVPLSKSGRPQGLVGSNPTLSARQVHAFRPRAEKPEAFLLGR